MSWTEEQVDMLVEIYHLLRALDPLDRALFKRLAAEGDLDMLHEVSGDADWWRPLRVPDGPRVQRLVADGLIVLSATAPSRLQFRIPLPVHMVWCRMVEAGD